ncbi:MAG: acetolactate synthase small subunit [Christensenellales bacterium]|jgi:acetolactate synthase, small subunit
MTHRYVLSILVENHSGVLRRVSSLFARRGYNIESLSVGVTQDPELSRITVAVKGDEYIIDQIKKQVFKLVEVRKIELLDDDEAVYRELMLIKVKSTKSTRAEVLEIANIFRAHIIDVSVSALVLEATGDSKKLNALIKLLEPFTVLEIVRTGLAAVKRGPECLKETKK